MKNLIHHNFIKHNKNLFNSYKKKKQIKKFILSLINGHATILQFLIVYTV